MVHVHPYHVSYLMPEFALLMLNVNDCLRRRQMHTYLAWKETLA